MTLRKFAEHIGVSPSYVSYIETGCVPPPSIEVLQQISRVFGINELEIFQRARREDEGLLAILKQRERLNHLLGNVLCLTDKELDELIYRAEQLSYKSKVD